MEINITAHLSIDESEIDIYKEYLAEIKEFKKSDKPVIGDKWPADGNYLPTAEVFLDSVKK